MLNKQFKLTALRAAAKPRRYPRHPSRWHARVRSFPDSRGSNVQYGKGLTYDNG